MQGTGPKKILAVITTEYGVNGITAVARNIYRHMDHDRFRMDFAVKNMPSLELKEEIIAQGGRILILPDRKKELPAYLRALKKLLEKERYDGIHVHGNSATMAFELFMARWSGVPVRIAHGHNSSCDYQRTNRLLKPFFYRLYTTGITCSEEAGKWLYGDRSFLIFHNAVALKEYRYNPRIAAEMRRELGIAEEELVIGHIGAFSKVKNQKLLVESLALMAGQSRNLWEKVCVLFAGAGEKMEETKEAADKAGIRGKIRFLGNRNDVPKLLQVMDLFVLPSLYEGLPLVLVEAQAAGLSCVVSDGVTAQADLCGGMEFVSLCGGAEALGAAIRKTIGEGTVKIKAEEREKISEANCRKLASLGYDIEQEVKRIERIYQGGAKG